MLWIVLLFQAHSLFAQLSVPDHKVSAKFETTDEWAKVKQLRNGNTLLIEVSTTRGMTVSLFDSSTTRKASNVLRFSTMTGKVSAMRIIEIQESGNDLALYLVDKVKRSLTLYRIILDGKSGKLKSETLVLEIPPLPIGSNWARDYGNVGSPYFNIYTDRKTGYYGIVQFTPYAVTEERIQVFHFNPDHQIINQSFFNAPESGYKYLDAMNVFVKGGEYLLLFSKTYNGSLSGKATKLYMSLLPRNKSFFINRVLPVQGPISSASILLKYDYQKSYLKAFLQISKESDYGSYYSLQTATILPDSLELVRTSQIPVGYAYGKYRQTVGKPLENYSGMPHLFTLDQHGNNFVLLQKTSIISKNGALTTHLGDIVLSCFDENGNEKYGDFIRCNYMIQNGHSFFTYDDGLINSKPEQRDLYLGSYPNDWNLTINQVSTSRYTYLFRNDHLANYTATGVKKAKQAKKLPGLALLCYKYSSDSRGLLEKNMLGQSKTGYFNLGASDFNPVTNTFATLQLEITIDPVSYQYVVNGKLVWFKLD